MKSIQELSASWTNSEAALVSARSQWFSTRKARILDRVEAKDVLSRFGIEAKEEKSLPCPFHGDTRPSAIYHGQNSQGPSHLWCFVCRKNWDAIGLWVMFRGCTYGQAMKELEQWLGLPVLPIPRGVTVSVEKEDHRPRLEMLERMTLSRRESLGLERYAKFCQALDYLWFVSESNPEKLEHLMGKYLEKLCPGISSSAFPGWDSSRSESITT